ncbi:MAG: tetratricopeptide repeat protein, partial [Acidobacteria bacterium]|nr:tetratricopeptide repeat protein [Acidobacteriota bacterium]
MASKREALVQSAQKNLQKGKVDAALKDYLKVLEETPNDISILNTIGDLFVRLNKNEESIPYFLKIAEHYGKDGFFLKAIAIYKKINKLDPARLDIYERLAELYSKQGLGMEAKSQYQVLADYYTKQDNIQGAIAIYQKMVAGDTANIQLHIKLADLFTQARRVPDALKEFAVVAGMLKERGALDEAIQVYERALKHAPDNVEILKSFVPLLLDGGKIDQARECLRKALETTPRSVPLFVLAAEAALTANDLAEARSYSSKAQAVDPENEEVLLTVVRVQLKGRRPDLAFAAASPLADAAVRRGEAKKALAILQPIAKGAPDNEEVLKKICEIAKAAGDEQASVPFLSALAELWRKQGKIVEAAATLRDLTRLAPDVTEFRGRLAQIEPLLPAAAAPPRQDGPDPGDISFPGLRPGAPAPPVAAVVPTLTSVPPVSPVPSAVSNANEFEFELPDEELSDSPPMPVQQPPVIAPPPAAVTASRTATSPGIKAPGPQPPPAPLPPMRPASLDKTHPGLDPRSLGAPIAPPPSDQTWMDYDAQQQPPTPRLGTTPPGPSFPPPLDADAIDFDVADVVADSGLEMAEEVEEAGQEVQEPLPTPPPSPVLAPQPAPVAAAAPQPAAGSAKVDEALVESEVFRKYGLLEKAAEHLRNILKNFPDANKAHEKLFEIYLEQGKKALAKEEAAILVPLYRAEGRDDRIKALEGLLGESLDPSAAALLAQLEVHDVPAPPPVAAAPAPVLETPPPPAPAFEAAPEPPPPLEARAEAPPPLAATPAPEPEPAREELKPMPAAPPSHEPAAPVPHDLSSLMAPPAAAKPRPAAKADDLLSSLTAPKAAAKPKPAASAPADLARDLLGPKPAPTKPREPRQSDSGVDLIALLPPKAKPKPAAAQKEAEDIDLGDLMAPSEPAPPPPVAPVAAAPVPPPVMALGPSPQDLGDIDFCLDQGMVVDAAERLQSLEGRFPGHPDVVARRHRLEGARSPSEDGRAALGDIFSDDLESVLDAELGKALTQEMAKEAPPSAAPRSEPAHVPPVDES